MAHHTDYHGLYFTLQSLRLHHPEAMQHCELIVVDNSIGSPHSQMAGGLINGAMAGRTYNPNSQTWDDRRDEAGQDDQFAQVGLAGARVVHLKDDIGTSATRQKIFEEAAAPAVLVMDCHVLLPPGTLDRLLDWYDTDEPRADIYSGPLIYDTLRGYLHMRRGETRPQDVTTHFDDAWRGEMWGTWGKAWRCNCGPKGVHLATVQHTGDGGDVVQFRSLETQVPITACYNCDQALPEALPWANHQQALHALGFYPLGESDTDAPFAIPGCGLGVFSARVDSWPGFNEHAKGFGGEELYIHTKYRQQGGRAICLPWLKWLHRFGRPDGVPYPLTLYNKVRNYVLELDELGLSLDPIHEHFVLDGQLTQANWEHLTDDPITNDEPLATGQPRKCGGCQATKQLDNADTLDALYAILASLPRDLDQHLPTLRDLAGKVGHVTEITKRRESTVALLSARPAALVSYQIENDRTLTRAIEYARADGVDVEITHRKKGPHTEGPQDATDLLFIDDEHRAQVLREQLAKWGPRVSRFIVLHDTQTHGETGVDGGPGLLPVLRDFMADSPEWSVISHTEKQHGLTVVGRLDEDKPQLPPATELAGNLGKALVGFAFSAGKTCTADELEARLKVCSTCTQRRNTRCAVCGCYLAAKAKLASQTCPLGYWPKLDEAAQ